MKSKKRFILLIGGVVVLLSLAMMTQMSQAQDNDRSVPMEVDGETAVTAHSNYIPIQGQLTDASGTPLNGTHSIVFRLYDVMSGGTALCEDTISTTVTDGLFNTYIGAAACPIDGRSLYLGIQVGSDPEMTPRQYIDNVPYAWSLRPGAKVKASSTEAIFLTQNNGTGSAITGQSVSADTGSIGVEGTSLNGTGVIGKGFTGTGIVGDSFSGTAIKATGTGIIQSSANSYLWISGNGVRKFRQSDSTVIDMNTIGGARITRGASSGDKNVMLPITIPGQLYGQDVTVTDLDIYWVGDTEFDGITAVLLRRQTGVCTSCYKTILHSTADHSCHEDVETDGCVVHYDLATNNVLDDGSGILYLTLDLSFSGSSTFIDVGGVRLTLAHE